MANWWDTLPDATATLPESDGNWWDSLPDAVQSDGTPVEPDIAPPEPIKPVSKPQPAVADTELNRLSGQRERELATGVARDFQNIKEVEKRFFDLGGSYDKKWGELTEPQQQALLDLQIAKRHNVVGREALGKDLAAMRELGMTPEEYRIKESYDSQMERGGPDSRLANLPFMRGMTEGAMAIPSAIAQQALRLTGYGDQANAMAASRQEDAKYNDYADQQQGKAASFARQATEMITKYTPAGAVGGTAGVLGAIGTETLSQKQYEGLQSGMSEGGAFAYGAVHATKDMVLTWLGGKVAGKLGGRTLEQAFGMSGGKAVEKGFTAFARQLATGTAVEIGIEEWPQYILESAIDKFTRDDYQPKSWEQVYGDLKEIAAVTAVMQAAMAPIDTASPEDASKSQAAKDFIEKPTRSNAFKAGLSWLIGDKMDSAVPTAKDRERVAKEVKAKIADALTVKQFREQLGEVVQAGNITTEQADYLFDLVGARAKAAGETLDDYLATRVKGVESAKWADFKDKGDRNSVAKSRRAEIEFLQEDGRAIIRAFEQANFVSMIHELGHLFRRDLAGPDMDFASRWAGAKNGEWNRNAEEKFARGFETYMSTGKAPTTTLKRVFGKIAKWMKGTYGAARKQQLVSPEMTQVYDRLFAPEMAQQTQQAAEAAANQTFADDLQDRFRGLAVHTEIPEVRAENYAADEALGFPERRKWAEAQRAAAERLKSDPDGELAAMLAKIEAAKATGGVVDLSDMTEMALAAKLKEAVGQRITSEADRALFRTLNQSFRNARSEYARVLNMRDPTATPAQRQRNAITEAIMRPNDKEQKKLDGAKNPEDRKRVEGEIDERIRKTIEELQAEGIDLNDIDALLRDKMKSLQVLDRFRRSTAVPDMIYEYWRNAILSGPRTHAANIAGNAAFSAWHLAVERPVEALFSVITRNKKSAQLGEFKYMLQGLFPGLARGVRNAKDSWKLETSALSEELGRDGAFKFDGPRGAIPGKIGRELRIPYRALLAQDEFFKSITATVEAGAHAFRAGKSLGLEGNKLAEFVHNQVNDLNSAVWDVALKKAEELAFQGAHGVVAEAAATTGKVLRKIPAIGKWIVPFVDTPAKILEEGLKRTPVLGAMLDWADARRKGVGLADMHLEATLARQAIGFVGAMLLWDAVDQEDPWVTGSVTDQRKGAKSLAFATNPPNSIRIGNRWYSYERIEPFATAVGWTVDVLSAAKNGGNPGREALTSPLRQTLEKSYLEGLSDFVDVLQKTTEGDFSSPEEYASRLAMSFVPNLYRQIVGSTTQEIPETAVWGKGAERAARVGKRALQQGQIPGVQKLPRYDIWGQRLTYNDSLGNAGADFLWALLSPVKTKLANDTKEVDAMLLMWNRQNPDKARYWPEAPHDIQDRKETHYLTDQQFSDYAELSGQYAQEAVSKMRVNVRKPTEAMVNAVAKRISAARRRAKAKLLPQWRKEWATTPTPAASPRPQ